MKYLLVGSLLMMTAMVTQRTPVHAQALNPDLSKPASTLGAPLVTQPASLKSGTVNSRRSTTPYTADQLNGILGTLQANPKAPTATPQNSLESLIQRFSVSTPKKTTIDPIDFFKPPALDGGVKIPLQR